MKPTVDDLVMLVTVVVAAVLFYLELMVWDAHGWSRDSLGLLAFGFFAVIYLGWRAWRWWRRRNSK